MLKTVSVLICLIIICHPAIAQDTERINAISTEVESRQIKQYLQVFENFQNLQSDNPKDTLAANGVVSALNALTKKYPSVNQFYGLVSELSESGYYSDSAPLLMTNLYYSLQKAKEFGFGSGVVGNWQFKKMARYPKGSPCGAQSVDVFYTSIKHPSKSYSFGFTLSAGAGFIDQNTLKAKTIDEECY